jgi:hypothetical protein
MSADAHHAINRYRTETQLLVAAAKSGRQLPAELRASSVSGADAAVALFEVANLHQAFWKDPHFAVFTPDELAMLEHDLTQSLGWVQRAMVARHVKPLLRPAESRDGHQAD